MNSNTHSTGTPEGLSALAAAVDGLAAQDLNGLPDGVRAERVLGLRRLLDRLEGHWLQELAELDARGAAGAEQGLQAPSTASWLRARLRMGPSVASNWVRTARALFRGPLTATAVALTGGELSAAHASVLASGTQDLPGHLAADAEPVLLAAARRLDPPRLRRVVAHLRLVADPDGADHQAERLHQRRGLWLAPTWEGMVAIDGLLEPEAGHLLLAALEPLARPASADDERSGGQRWADALGELARRTLEGGALPQTGGVRPQLTVTVDLDSLLDRHPGLGGEVGWAGPLPPEACQRLACDAALTRVLVTRHPTGHAAHDDGHRGGARDHPTDHHGHDNGARDHPTDHHGHDSGACDHPTGQRGQDGGPGGDEGLAGRLRAAAALLPPVLGGAPTQPLEVGRTSRVVVAAQRTALAVRDGGCVFPRLRATPGLVRRSPPAALAARRPDRPGESGLVVPGPSPGGARGRLAAGSPA